MRDDIVKSHNKSAKKFFTKKTLLSRKKRIVNEIPITKVKKLDNNIVLVTFNF